MKRLLGAAVAASLFVLPAQAATVTLGFDANGPRDWNIDNASTLILSPTVPAGNQVDNIPCIICGKNQTHQPDGFGYNLFGNTGNETNVSFFSTSVVPNGGQSSGLAIDQIGAGYSIGDGTAFKLALLGRTDFTVGIDVNDTNTPQTLESFWFLNLTQHTVLAVFSPGPGGTLLANANNGTGYPDWTLSGFDINRGDIALGDQIIFFARISGANDGPDSFFINPNAQVAVPGPIAGAGLPGLLAACGGLIALHRRRRRCTA